MKIKNLVVVLPGLILLGALNLEASGRREPEEEKTYRHRRPERYTREDADERRIREGKLLGELELTQNQREKMRQRFRESVRERKELREEITGKYRELREKLASDEIDEPAVDEIIGEITSIRQQQLRKRVRGLYEFREILTDEQWEKIKERGMMRMMGK